MEVYIEDIFLDNFIIDFLILLIVSKLLHKNAKIPKLIIASIFGVGFTLLNLAITLNGIWLLIYKLGIGLLITLIAFNDKKFIKILLNYLSFLLITALMGGICFLICFSFGKILISPDGAFSYELGVPVSVILLVITLTSYFALKIYEKVCHTAKISNFVYKAKLCNHNHQIEVKAFLDSGNTLTDPLSGKPVTIITYEHFKRIYKNVMLYDLLLKHIPKDLKNAHYITAGSINQKKEMLVFTVEFLHIIQNKKQLCIKDASIGLSFADFEKTLDCGLLLNPNILNGE